MLAVILCGLAVIGRMRAGRGERHGMLPVVPASPAGSLAGGVVEEP